RLPSCSLFRLLICSGDPRALHSFPTRRSSDLPPWRWSRRRAGSPPSGGAEGVELGGQPPVRWQGGGGRLQPLAAAGALRLRHHQDRKSTRLNSSHVKISYAVFCLKKKKQTPVA